MPFGSTNVCGFAEQEMLSGWMLLFITWRSGWRWICSFHSYSYLYYFWYFLFGVKKHSNICGLPQFCLPDSGVISLFFFPPFFLLVSGRWCSGWQKMISELLMLWTVVLLKVSAMGNPPCIRSIFKLFLLSAERKYCCCCLKHSRLHCSITSGKKFTRF